MPDAYTARNHELWMADVASKGTTIIIIIIIIIIITAYRSSANCAFRHKTWQQQQNGSKRFADTAKYLYLSVPMTQHAYYQARLTCDTDVV